MHFDIGLDGNALEATFVILRGVGKYNGVAEVFPTFLRLVHCVDVVAAFNRASTVEYLSGGQTAVAGVNCTKRNVVLLGSAAGPEVHDRVSHQSSLQVVCVNGPTTVTGEKPIGHRGSTVANSGEAVKRIAEAFTPQCGAPSSECRGWCR